MAEENIKKMFPAVADDQHMEAEEQALIEEMEAIEKDKAQQTQRINLNDQASLALLKATIENLEINKMVKEAKEFATRLENRLHSEPTIPENFKRDYEQFLLRAQFLSLSVQDDVNIVNLLQSKILNYLKLTIAHVDVAQEIEKSFTRYIDPLDLYPYYENLLNSFQDNTESLGTRNIMFVGKAEKPKIKNWIHDYIAFCNIKFGANKKISTFERLSYINEGANPKSLNKEERDLLLAVLAIYDKLRFDPISRNESSEVIQKKAIYKQVEALGSERLPETAPVMQSAAAPPVPRPPVRPPVGGISEDRGQKTEVRTPLAPPSTSAGRLYQRGEKISPEAKPMTGGEVRTSPAPVYQTRGEKMPPLPRPPHEPTPKASTLLGDPGKGEGKIGGVAKPTPPMKPERQKETAWPRQAQTGADLTQTDTERIRKIGVVPGTPLPEVSSQQSPARHSPEAKPMAGGEVRSQISPPSPTLPTEGRESMPSVPPKVELPRLSATEAAGIVGQAGPKKVLPPPPRPPKFTGGSLGEQAHKENIGAKTAPLPNPPYQGEGSSTSPGQTTNYKLPTTNSSFSINDALARAGEDNDKKLTGGLPKKS